MSLPADATVRPAASFSADLASAVAFFEQQDPRSALARANKLREGLAQAVSMLAWAPTCGRLARLGRLSRSAPARARVQALATQAGLPHLREFVVGQHILLYAHSDEAVLLLALKHERQLEFSVAR